MARSKRTRTGPPRLLEASRFLMRQGDVYETLRRLAHRLEASGLAYAVIGGMAVVEHGSRRTTEDIDVVMTEETLREFRERFLGRGYLPAFEGAERTFRDTATGVRIEVVTAGSFPGDGQPKSVAFPDPGLVAIEREGFRVVPLETLVELKLASGMTAPHRLRDLADVQDLIARANLPLELADRLDVSVRDEYRRLWTIVSTAPPEEARGGDPRPGDRDDLGRSRRQPPPASCSPTMKDTDCVAFLQWALPRLQMRWPGFRKVRKQVCKRIDRRLSELGLAHIEDYRDHLERHPGEWPILDGFCRIPISRFCRDRAVFEFIRDETLPALAAAAEARGDRTLRGWSAGCASGEEVYTLNMIWKLAVGRRFPSLALRLMATDSDPDMIERARRARYSWSSVRELPEEWRAAAFTRDAGSLQLDPEFRGGVELMLQDIRHDMPRRSFDLILCRNLTFTYFDEPLQCRILDGLLARLLPGGFLVIGQRESLPRVPDDLEPVRRGLGAYRRA